MAFKMNGWSAFTSPDDKRRLKEAKKSLRNLRLERLKKIGNKEAQANLKSAIAGLKEKKNQLKNK